MAGMSAIYVCKDLVPKNIFVSTVWSKSLKSYSQEIFYERFTPGLFR